MIEHWNKAPAKEERIQTIGYTEPGAEERIAEFLKQEGAALIDIRMMPRSRYYWRFNKDRLSKLYPSQYIHMPDFGNVNYRPNDRAKGIKIAKPGAGLHQIMYLLNDKFEHPIMLMCACKDYSSCHRKVVYEMIMAILAGKPVFYEGEELEYHLMGVEQGFDTLGVSPGWYPCIIEKIYRSGNVKIFFTCPPIEYINVTVLKRNIPIAFRKPTEVEDAG